MEKTFSLLEQEYADYYRSFLEKGGLPLIIDDNMVWGYSVTREIFDLFKELNLEKYSSLLDLGSGDGKVVNIASMFTKATGIEQNEELFNKSIEVSSKFNLKNASFIKDSFLNHDFSRFDIIFFYPDKKDYILEQKLVKEMKGILVFEGDNFIPISFKKIKTVKIGMNNFTLYKNH